MTEIQFLSLQQRRLAQVSISTSTLRGQGKGSIAIARDYLEKNVDLEEFAQLLRKGSFNVFLDNHTTRLSKKLPSTDDNKLNWGAARKSLNIFFRGVLYNAYWAKKLGLPLTFAPGDPLIDQLEIPLDSHSGKGIRKQVGNACPKWRSIKGLDSITSASFQHYAESHGKMKGISRVHLDLILWRP